MNHQYDDEGVCVHCGFDGAEWHWWRHSTWEGRSQPDAVPPPCIRDDYGFINFPTEKE